MSTPKTSYVKFSDKLTDGPEWVFAALAAADGNVAITTKAKESKAFKNVVKNYSSSSQLVQEVLGDKTKASRDVKRATVSDAEQALEEINKILDDKLSPSEASQYRKFLTSIADSVAEAAGEGVLGVGKKISKKEEKVLGKVKSALKPKKAVKVETKPSAPPKAKTKPTAPSKAKTKPAAPTKAKVKPSRPAKQRVVASPPRPQAVKPKISVQKTAQAETFIAEHKVASGETLSHLSLKYYGSAAKPKYMIIYEANKDVIGDNPNVIVPGQVLKIPKLDK